MPVHLKCGHQYVCHLKHGHIDMIDAMIHCHAYAHGFIAKLFLKLFGSNSVSCRFNTIQLK